MLGTEGGQEDKFSIQDIRKRTGGIDFNIRDGVMKDTKRKRNEKKRNLKQ